MSKAAAAAAFTRAPIALAQLDPSGIILFANPAFEQLAGYPPAHANGRDIFELLAGGRADAAAALQRTVRLAEGREVEIEIRTRAGDARRVACVASAAADGDPAEHAAAGGGTTVALRDVGPERDRIGRELHARSLAAISRLVSGVAHEVNNPLTGVIGFSEVLLLDETDPVRRDALERVIAEAQRVAKIVRDLLVFSRRARPEKIEGSLADAIAKAIDTHADVLAAAGIAVSVDVSTNVPRFAFDPTQMTAVMAHLVRNAEQAIRSAGREGRLSIRARLAGERVVVEVEDDGPGVAPADLERLFFPFFTTRSVGSGTGLGLAFAYGVALEHGGDLTHRAVSPCGACFTLTLPVPRPRPPEPALPAGAASERARVLLVDDEAAVRGYVHAALTHFGHEVIEAPSAEDALPLARTSDFDLILLDVKMPGMGGCDLYDRLRVERPELAARVVFQTGDTVGKDTVRFVEESGRPLLAKPYSIDELRRVVADVLIANAAAAGLAAPKDPQAPA